MSDMQNSEVPASLPRKRRRPATACEQCRRRKIGCDAEQPCGPCVRSRGALQCTYRIDAQTPSRISSSSPRQRVNAASRQGPLPVADALPLSSQHDELGTLQLRGGPTAVHGSQVAELTQPKPPSPNPGLTRTVRELNSRILALEQQLADRPKADQLQNTRDNDSRSCSTPPIRLRLRNATYKTRIFGQGHWLHAAESLPNVPEFDQKEVEHYFENAEHRTDLLNIVNDCKALRQQVKNQILARMSQPIPDIVSTIPVKAVCDELVHGYLRTFELVYRIVHIPSFLKEYAKFWEDHLSISRPSLMRIVLILAIGTSFSPHWKDSENSRLAAKNWVYAAQWWLTGPSEKSTCTIDGLQVYCLLILARQTCRIAGFSSALNASSLVNMAMAMGLHRDPENFSTLSFFQSEMRRRLWATVVELGLLSALDTSLPLLLSSQDFDAKPPSNINDAELDHTSNDSLQPHPTTEYTDSSIQLLLLNSLPVRLEVAQTLTDFRHKKLYEQALDLGSKLKEACRQVATFFHTHASQQATREPAPSDFHRKFLDMHIRRCVMLVHRPFMLQARKDPRFYLSRKICLESCTVFLSYADGLDLPNDPPDDLCRLMILGSASLRGALSTDIIMTTVLEIVTQLEEEGCTRQFDQPETKAEDPADAIARANREPLIRRLEHIHKQLEQIIASGDPTIKRYNFLAALLVQIRAMESGRPANVKASMHAAVYESLHKTYRLLQASRVGLAPQESLGTMTTGAMTYTPGVGQSFGLDFNALDVTTGFDLASLLGIPGLDEEFVFEA